jgi:hypothetical protein
MSGLFHIGQRQVTSTEETRYLKQKCPVCGNFLEFPDHGIGQLVPCPHCNEDVLLRDCGQQREKYTDLLLVAAILLISVTSIVVICSAMYKASEEENRAIALEERLAQMQTALNESQREKIAWATTARNLQVDLDRANLSLKFQESLAVLSKADLEYQKAVELENSRYEAALRDLDRSMIEDQIEWDLFQLNSNLQISNVRAFEQSAHEGRIADELSRLRFNAEQSRIFPRH